MVAQAGAAMMPGDAATYPPNGPTLDQLFRAQAQRNPDGLALADPLNRVSFTDGQARRLTYAEADCAVDAIAARLRQMGLPTDAIVGIQLPNIVEHVLAMLGVWRAGMIVAPLPLLWRRADAVAALSRIGAKALVTCGHVRTHNYCQIAMGVAADVFSIRYVCAFGQNIPDGVVPFDDLLSADKAEPPPRRERLDQADAPIAAVTFDVTGRGVATVARTHAELIAGGVAVVRETGLAEDSGILSTLAPASFAGLALTLVPWLLRGGPLVLHHPFDAGLLARQRRQERCATLVLPGPLVSPLAASGAFAIDGPANVIAAWRSPDQLATTSSWREPDAELIDVAIFGEAALVAGRRGAGGKPRALHSDDATVEVKRTEAGTLAVRGAMAPHRIFPPGIDRSGLPYFQIGADGWIDTGYACRIDSVSKAIVVTAPPSGIASVGGLRFPLRDLADVVSRVDSAATLAALPDPLVGQRLIGNAADRAIMQAALNAVGVNPLVVAAFRDRSERERAFADAG
jgi:hypothetical protein